MIKTLAKAQQQERVKFRVPRSVQDAIPIRRIWSDGIFLCGNQYSKTWSFTDINYAIAGKDDKTAMFLDYSELLNALDSGASAKITLCNRRVNKAEFERSVLLPMKGDTLDEYRREFNEMLLAQTAGSNSIVRERYLTVSVVKRSMLIRRFHTPPPESGKPRAWIPALTLFPLCTLFVLYQVYDAGSAAGENNAWMFCLLVMCAVDMVALFLLDQLESTAQMREALAVAHQRAEIQAANVKALGDSYTAQRKMTHEFRGYLFTLSDLLAKGNTAAAQSYLDELKVRQTERILLVNTHNPIIDAIFNQKGYAAKEQDIDLHFEINDLSEMSIPSVDLTVVMSNLLDNAIEACEKLEKQERRMAVKAIYNKSDNPPTLFFSVENASKSVEIFGDHIPTTKPEPELHGFGLPNVMDILHKYGVFYLMDYKDGSFLFCLEWPDTAKQKAVVTVQNK